MKVEKNVQSFSLFAMQIFITTSIVPPLRFVVFPSISLFPLSLLFHRVPEARVSVAWVQRAYLCQCD